MKLFLLIFFLLLFNNCSFDNKTGIWENRNISISGKNNEIFKGFKTISISEKVYKKKLTLKKNLILDIPNPIINKSWQDIFYSPNNNLKNFKYNNSNEIIFKSKKLSKYHVNNYKLFEDGNLIINDKKGNLIIFSLEENKIISKFNFYKKKFKKIKKDLNFIVDNKIIYVADNLGYIYAYNYKIGEIIWAKNYKIPFNSNLKTFNDKIAISNQNNNLYIINKNNGDLLKSIPTEEFFVKNKFKNNLSSNESGELFFLNSFGSLYSIDLTSMTVNWFNNFNQSLDITSSNYFDGSEIINSKKIVLISTNKNTFLINSTNGSIIKKFNFATKIKPIIIKNKAFILTNNNYLISIDLNNKSILYSFDISEIDDFNFDISKDNIYKKVMILNSEIFVFLKNSSILKFDINGNFKILLKLQAKLKSNPISIQNSILYLNNNNRLIVLN